VLLPALQQTPCLSADVVQVSATGGGGKEWGWGRAEDRMGMLMQHIRASRRMCVIQKRKGPDAGSGRLQALQQTPRGDLSVDMVQAPVEG
jgi:hypothetical protein